MYNQITDLWLFYQEFLSEWEKKWNIVIIHWWWGSSVSREEVWKDLSKKWYNVYVPDLPWFWRTWLEKIFSIEDYWDVVDEFVKYKKLDDFILLWHSNWWRISIYLVANSILKPKKLILNNSAWLNYKQSILKKTIKFFSKILKKFAFLPWYSFIRKILYKLVWGHDYLNTDNDLNKKITFENMLNCWLEWIMKNINIPTYLIWWWKDTYTPLKQWRKMNTLIKNSKLIILKNETHWIHLKNPKKLSKNILEILSWDE